MYLYFTYIFAFFPVVFCEDKLIHIHAIWRHGERNPAKTFFGDLNNASAFPEGFTQLTKKGIHQLFTLGKHFQARYIYEMQFLSPSYSNSEIYARSTDADRAIVSAMAFFSGLYSGNSSQDHILAPVPIHSIPASSDFLNVLAFECPRKDKLWKMVEKSEIIKSLLNNSNELLSEVSNKTEISIDFMEIMYVFDTAIFETYLGLPLPPWLIPRMPEFEALFANYIAVLWGFASFKDDSFEFDLQKELTKISSGPLISEIMDRLESKIQCQQNQTKECEKMEHQKFYAYSGHDITEISLLLGLGFHTFMFEKEEMPSVGSSIVLELWESEDIKNVAVSNNNQYEYYYVKIYYYQNSSVVNPKYIGDLIPECQGRKGCPISYLFIRAELLRPKPDLKSYCNQSINAGTKQIANFGYLLVSVLIFCFVNIY